MKEYIFRRSLIFMGCFLYLNACQAPHVHAIDKEEKDIPSFTREELLAGGGERSYDTFALAVQEELHEKILHDE